MRCVDPCSHFHSYIGDLQDQGSALEGAVVEVWCDDEDESGSSSPSSPKDSHYPRLSVNVNVEENGDRKGRWFRCTVTGSVLGGRMKLSGCPFYEVLEPQHTVAWHDPRSAVQRPGHDAPVKSNWVTCLCLRKHDVRLPDLPAVSRGEELEAAALQCGAPKFRELRRPLVGPWGLVQHPHPYSGCLATIAEEIISAACNGRGALGRRCFAVPAPTTPPDGRRCLSSDFLWYFPSIPERAALWTLTRRLSYVSLHAGVCRSLNLPTLCLKALLELSWILLVCLCYNHSPVLLPFLPSSRADGR